MGNATHYDGYNNWGEGDTKLDWWGAQIGQGLFAGVKAEGSSMAWTTNNASHPGYQPLNRWGDHHWMLDVNMDCSQTDGGWFELKGFMANGKFYFRN